MLTHFLSFIVLYVVVSLARLHFHDLTTLTLDQLGILRYRYIHLPFFNLGKLLLSEQLLPLMLSHYFFALWTLWLFKADHAPGHTLYFRYLLYGV